MSDLRKCPKCREMHDGRSYLCDSCVSPVVARPVDGISLAAANARIAAAGRVRDYTTAGRR